MDHKALVISMWAVVIALAAGVCECRAEEKPFSCRGLRHGHMFLIWNEAGGAPKITLTSLLFGKYTDGLEYKVIAADSKVLTRGEMDAGGKVEVNNLPECPRYLVLAEPGMNGVLLDADRPWGLVVGPTHPIGPNAPSGRLYFYVPPECKGFQITVCCRSPKEAAKIVVHRPDGGAAGELDGELDEETPLKVEVPAGGDGAVWSVEFLPPTAPGTFLDDVALNLEGELPLLLCPQPDWALKMGKEAWRIDKRR